MKYRLMFSLISIVLLISSSIFAYNYELVQSRVLESGVVFKDIDPVLDSNGVIKGFLYTDAVNAKVLLDMFEADSIRECALDTVSMTPANLFGSVCIMLGNTVRAVAAYNDMIEPFPQLAVVDFGPASITVDKISTGQSHEGPYNAWSIGGVDVKVIDFKDDVKAVQLSFTYSIQDLMSLPSVRSASQGNETFVYDLASLDWIWHGFHRQIAVGDFGVAEGYEVVGTGSGFNQFSQPGDPLYSRSEWTVIRIVNDSMDNIYGCSQDYMTSVAVLGGDVAPDLPGDEFLYYGSCADFMVGDCTANRCFGCFRLLEDSTVETIWCRDAGSAPIYLHDAQQPLAICLASGQTNIVDGATGVIRDSIALPAVLNNRMFFDAAADQLHLLGRTADTVKVYRLDTSTDAPDSPQDELPSQFTLSQNYPNPFNPTTTIEYSLPNREYVTLEVFNILGQNIQTLVDKDQSAGAYRVIWDGTNESGNPVATGVYLYRLRAGDFTDTREMLLLK